jgi:hypothetical protein
VQIAEANRTPQRNAKEGVEYPYNIFAPYGSAGTGFGNVYPYMFNYLMEQGATDIVVTGLSRGGQEAAAMLFENTFKAYVYKDVDGKYWNWWKSVVRGVIPVAGKGSGTPDYSKALPVEVLAFHGTKDLPVSWYESKKLIDQLNNPKEAPQRVELDPTGREAPYQIPATLRLIEGGDHDDSWNNAYAKEDINPYAQQFKSTVEKMLGTNTVVVPDPEVDRVPVSFFYVKSSGVIELEAEGKVLVRMSLSRFDILNIGTENT